MPPGRPCIVHISMIMTTTIPTIITNSTTITTIITTVLTTITTTIITTIITTTITIVMPPNTLHSPECRGFGLGCLRYFEGRGGL